MEPTRYVNPPGGDKVKWLTDNGRLALSPVYPPWDDSMSLVCVKDNGRFDAAAVIENERDWADFRDPEDYRPTIWFYVPTTALEGVAA